MQPRYCDQHPQIVRDISDIKRMLYILLGIALGSGVLTLSQVVGI